MHLVSTSTDPVVGHSALLQSFNHRSKTAQSDGPEQLARSAGVRNTDRRLTNTESTLWEKLLGGIGHKGA